MASIAIPSEFDLELESERHRWLRRRFLWLCAISILVTIALDAHDVWRALRSPRGRNEGFIEACECAASVLLYALAAAYAVAARRPRRRGRSPLGRLAMLLVVVVGLAEMGFERARVDLLSPKDLPPEAFGPATRGIAFASVALVVLFTNHLFACLFMPWTFGESLRPAAVLLVGYAAVLLSDVFRRQLPPGGLLFTLALAGSFMPGAAICWWRFSRFRTRFRLRFESSRYRMLQGELQAARELHESSLPSPIDRGPVRLNYAYEPMRQIGGDLLFVHRPPGNDAVLSAVVLDVTGHGIRAALTVNRLLGELERLFAESPDAAPDEILRGLNRYVALTLRRHTIFATAFVARVDAASGELRWASGGHPTAFVRRAAGDGRALHPLESTATLLGAIDGDQYDPAGRSTTLASGDVLIAYTDGIPEACDRSGAPLGTDGTQRLIVQACAAGQDPARWPGAILQSVLGHRGTPVEDDTLVVAISLAIDAGIPQPGMSAEARPGPTRSGLESGLVERKDLRPHFHPFI